MDDAMMSRLLQSYGASNNAQNANRVREFAASNPEVLEHRAMGMRGSVQNDNSDLLGPLLEKLMAQTDGVAPTQMAPSMQQMPEQQPLPTVQNATTPTRRAATAAPAPQMGPNLPMATGAVNPLDGPATTPAPQRTGSFWDDMMTVILGASSVAGRAAMNRRGGGGPTPPPDGGPAAAPKTRAQPRAIGDGGAAIPEEGRWDTRRGVSDVIDLNERYLPGADAKLPAPDKQLQGPNSKIATPPGKLEPPRGKLTSGRPDGNYEGTGKEVEGVNARNQAEKTAKKDVLQKEIASDNESNNRIIEQMRKRAREEAETADLVKKAKRAVGRR